MSFLSSIRRWQHAEGGFSAAAILILALPLLLGAFGYGFDSLRLSYLKTYLQGRADLAVQTAVTNVYTCGDDANSGPCYARQTGEPVPAKGTVLLGRAAQTGCTYDREAWQTATPNCGVGLNYSYTENTAAKRSPKILMCTAAQVLAGTTTATPTGVNCAGGAKVIGNAISTTGNWCGNVTGAGVTAITRPAYGVSFQVNEKISYVFLSLIGKPMQAFGTLGPVSHTLFIRSEAFVRASNC